jgi:hypothetical protein
MNIFGREILKMKLPPKPSAAAAPSAKPVI